MRITNTIYSDGQDRGILNLTSKKYLSQIEEVIKKAEAGDVYPVYLFIGDRPIILR